MKSIKILIVLTILLGVGVWLFWRLNDAGYYYRTASVKLDRGDYSGAEANYNKAIQRKPDYVEAYIGRGGAKYKQGDPAGALADYHKAVELKPVLLTASDLARNAGTEATNELGKQALALFAAGEYDKLGELAATFRSSKERYADGVWKLASVYNGLMPPEQASDEEWEARLLAIGRWAVARPDSITARVAWANLLVGYAWKARGSGKAETVSPKGWRLFTQRLVEAGKVLKEAKTLKEKCPFFWTVQFIDTLGLHASRAQFDAMFDEAIKFEPDCETYHFRRAIYLLPRWYGSEGEWQSDLAKSAEKVGGEKGDMLYAQVIWNMHQRYGVDPFLDGTVSWARLDRGFDRIEKSYPNVLAVKIEQAELAILFKNTQAAIFNHNGIVKREKGDYAGAIVDYTKAIQIKPDYAGAYGNRANAKRLQGDLDGALADLNKAIEIQPDYVNGIFNRASLKRARGDNDGAMADFNKVILLRPDFAEGYAGRAGLKQANGNYEGAIADFTRAIDLKPDFVQELYTARGNIRQYKGDRAGAADDFRKAAAVSNAGKQ
jgi:tetratricopeptide (TPR) repeat protein